MNSIGNAFSSYNNTRNEADAIVFMLPIITVVLVLGIFAYSFVLIAQAIKGFKNNFTMSLLKLFGGLIILVIYISCFVYAFKDSKTKTSDDS
jgi:hypothetical protein